MMNVDLLGIPTAVGLKVKLDRDIDREKPCDDNTAIIYAGKGQHAGEFRCAACGAHRGWLSHTMRDFILETVRRFGAPVEPIVVRQHQQENKTMAFQQKLNTGSLFKNHEKESERDRDYSGTINVDGREYWVSGWARTSKAGSRYLSLSLKAKVQQATSKNPIGEDLNDSIGF